MPSRYGTNIARAAKIQQAEMMKPLRRQKVRAGVPWLGYCPDIPPGTLDASAMSRVSGLITVSDALTNDDGWIKVASGSLPFADATHVVLLAQFPRLIDSATFTDNIDILALTAYDGSNNGKLYVLSASTGSWTQVTSEAAAGTAAAATFNADETYLWDSCVMSEGALGTYRNTAAIAQPIFIFCRRGKNVQVFPNATGDNNYQDLTDEFNNTFQAVTCCSFFGRAVFGNTREDATTYPQRVRWSVIGDAAALTSARVGAGAIDLTEVPSEIIRVLPLGDTIAVYFRTGFAQLLRTGIPTAPFTRRYSSHRRGLFAPRAVCQIGPAQHFVIATDGWYIVDEEGHWQEVGKINAPNGLELHKWKASFYAILDDDAREQMVCEWDPYRAVVRISTTTVYGNRLSFNYDPKNDRLWPDDYGTKAPTYFGFSDRLYGTGPTWASVGGTWAAPGSGVVAWGDGRQFYGYSNPIFGTENGYVYVYSRSTIKRDGELPAWNIQSTANPLGAFSALKTSDRLWLYYKGVANQTASVQGGFVDATNTSATEAVTLGATVGQYGVAHFDGRLSSHSLAWSLGGLGGISIQEVEAWTFGSEGTPQRPFEEA